MPSYAPKPKSTFEPAPQGTFLARCIQYIHIGTNEETLRIPGKPVETKMVDKISLTFELPTKTKVYSEEKGAQPIFVSKEFTYTVGSKSNLRKAIEGIIGTTLLDKEAYAFDLESLVSMPCVVTTVHKTAASGNIRTDIKNIAPLVEGQVCPPQVNPSKILSYTSWDQEVFDSLPQFMKDKIMSSEEYQAKFVGTLTPETKAALGSFHKIPVAADDINPDDINFG